MKRDEMEKFARAGLDAEIARLTALRDALSGPKRASRKQAPAVATSADGDTQAPTRKRRKRTAAERKAVSLRMKKYWAERRKGEKK